MPRPKILVDSSFLFAVFNADEEEHADALAVVELYDVDFTIPYTALTEVVYLFQREGTVDDVAAFLLAMATGRYEYEILLPADFLRMREILLQYRDANLDFVDCCIMALSERLDVTQVGTLDHRDFNIFRPKHADFLELLP